MGDVNYVFTLKFIEMSTFCLLFLSFGYNSYLGGDDVYGKKLKELRKIEGWTQEEVAKRLGVSKQTYSHYENEKRRPGLDTIRELAGVYQVNIDDIFSQVLDNQKNPNSFANEKEFASAVIELSDEETIQKFKLTIDGQEMTEKQMKRLIAFARMDMEND
jgi:transcriptional regulator with XRE-family HTH domain